MVEPTSSRVDILKEWVMVHVSAAPEPSDSYRFHGDETQLLKTYIGTSSERG